MAKIKRFFRQSCTCLILGLSALLLISGACLAVEPDTTPPSLTSALNLGPTQIRITFSKPVSDASANAVEHYTISNGATLSAATLSGDTTNVVLTVSTLTFGANYTVSVNELQDLATPPNTIQPNSKISFVALEFAPQSIGYQGGAILRIDPSAFDVTGGGTDIGGTSDKFQFASLQRTGNFDVQVRVADVTTTSPFLHAGLMARGTLDANAQFVAVFASSAALGSFFESRATAGTASVSQTLPGGFPANYPHAWLRLSRKANVFTGFGSLEGQTWVQLGTATIALPSSVYFGFAVASQNPTQQATAQFRDFGGTTSLTTGSFKPDREPLGPSSRRTRLVISEILYHPASIPGIKGNLEFVEIYNAGIVFEDLTGWKLTGAIDFQFPAGFKLAEGAFVVVAADPAALQSVYRINGVLGPFKGALDNEGGTLRLRDGTDAIKLEMTYNPNPPWPVAADGAGPSIVLARPSYGENDPRAWSASERIGGTPGQMEAVLPNPQQGVVINEFLAHTDEPQFDFIELYNHNNWAIDLSGCILTDDPATNRFRIPDGTAIQPRNFLAWDQNQLGFSLNAAGESLYLISSNGTRVLDAVRFGAQENGIASGRSPDGSSTIRRLAQPTAAAANAAWRREDIVVNEVMFHPLSGDDADEYVELYNRGGSTVDLSGWRFLDGIDYQIPPTTRLAAGDYMVVAKDVSRLLANYPQLRADNVRGNYGGSLANSGETLTLAKPIDLVSTNSLGELKTNTVHAVVAETAYVGGGRWGYYADGGGSSLELTDPGADPLRASNWADSDETRKAPWTLFEYTGPLDNGVGSHPANRFRISMQGAGECLVDDLEIYKPGSTNLLSNPGFENGVTGWSLFGNHSTSFIETTGAFAGSSCLHVRSQGDGDTGINAIRANLASGLASGNTATIRAQVRWLAGWPEVLFRTRGGWTEMPVRMKIPKNLGSPGGPNSRLVPNAGPAIYDVSHSPALPRANQAVLVTCRVSDPDGFGTLTLRYRVDPAASTTRVSMRDDGGGGDEVAGDGIYSANLTGRSASTVVAFSIEAQDGANVQATTIFPKPDAIVPSATPALECLIRWDDPSPFGTFGHYHIWNTQNTQSKRSNALNNTYRDCTLVYGNFRIIYNAGFRDKGSPYHSGSGDYAVTVPSDDMLLGVTDRVFGSTGNGGSEETGLRSQVSGWLGGKLGLPYLNSHYIRVYRNGTQHQNVSEDLEQPNNEYAEGWFPGFGQEGDLHKIAVWFEFQDNNLSFDATGATLQRFTSQGALKTGRYRWNWQRRPQDGTANNFTNLFELVNAINSSSDYVNKLLQLADVEQWMRVFAYHRILGNWDSYTFSVGQNMFAYKAAGRRWVLIPWDIDFVLGLGNGATDPLTVGGQDPVANSKLYEAPAFRRALWRAYTDAVNGPMLPDQYAPQIAARRNALLQNGITGITSTNAIYSYLNGRRNFIIAQLKLNDAPLLTISNNGGADFSATSPTVTLTGNAPFAAATIEVNGIPYPVTWTSPKAFSMVVPLTKATNKLVLMGADRQGQPLTNMATSITVTYAGIIERPFDFVVINEIQYHPSAPRASFIELFNRSPNTPFDLSNYRLDGLGYTFPEGAILPRNGYLVLASDRAAFANAYGNTLPVFDVFPGSLDNGGEHLRLVQPSFNETPDGILSDVRYDDKLPWPLEADGLGPSLQLIDATRDPYRVGNWTAAAIDDVNRATPGRANGVAQNLAPFPLVWLNEVLPNNVAGPADNAGELDPFVEIHNSGSDTIELSEFFLTDSYTNLNRWQFPPGSSLAPKSFMVVWADGQPQQSVAGVPHTSFRLNPTNGSLALARFQGREGSAAVMDFLDYKQLSAGRSFGSFPDGEPRNRRSFFHLTAGASNNPTFPEIGVRINEFMAGNTNAVSDPADGRFDDWFELHNGGAVAADLSSYRLTDNLTNTTQFVIPPGYVIPPGGFLLVWADKEPKQNAPENADLHVNFKLAVEGGQIGLYSPDGQLIDGITYGQQTNDVSAGRYPDGADGAALSFEQTTPRAANFLPGGNRPPTLNPIPSQSIVEQTLLAFSAKATDPDAGQKLTFSLGADAPPGAAMEADSGLFTWTPSEQQGPATFLFTARVTDDGLPPRTSAQRMSVSVLEANRAPVLAAIVDQTVDEGSLLNLQVVANDPDLPANKLSFSLDPGAPAGVEIDAARGNFSWIPLEDQGPAVYSITVRVTDDGPLPLMDSKVMRITVNEVNNPPIFNPILPQTLDEGDSFRFATFALDPDSPASALTYSLEGNLPAGLVIDPATGMISWMPTEAQGPATHVVIVRATENNAGQLSTSRNFGITVNEVNQPPVLSVPTIGSVEEGSLVSFSATAMDGDQPAQRLLFSLLPGAPAGAEIDPNTGAFAWRTPEDSGGGSDLLSVRVTDDGPGARSDTKTLSILVRPRFRVALNEVMYRPAAPGSEYIELANFSAVTTWDISGYRLQGNDLSFVFPANTRLAPGAFVCVIADPAKFVAAYGAKPLVIGAWTGTLGTSADDIRLAGPRPSDALVDRVSFRVGSPWPAAARDGGISLQVVDSRRDRARVANWAAAMGYSGPRALIAITNLWRYYQSGPLEAGWNTPSFNDSAWPQGRALLYVETAALPAPKSTALTLGQNTYYFRTTFVLPSLPAGGSLVLSNILDDGAVFYLNGKELHRQGIEPGPVDFNTVGSDFRSPGTAVGDAAWAGPFLLPSNTLVIGTNVLAVEVHQVNTTSSDIVFGCRLDLELGTLVGLTPGAANSVAALLPEFPTVWINEIVVSNTAGIVDGQGQREPWIELLNSGPEAVSLDGWFLSDNYGNLDRWAFPVGTAIQPHQFLLIFADGQPEQTTQKELHTSFRLNPTSGSLALSRTQLGAPAVMDYLDYANLSANEALASIPDGQPYRREPTSQPTPAGPNATSSNRPPSLGPLPGQTVIQGARLAFTLPATDPELNQQLTFSLEGSVPVGATVNALSGAFEWIPLGSDIGVHALTVVATDNGVPPLSATGTFEIVVRAAAAPVLTSAALGNTGAFALSWVAEPGVRYRAEYKDHLRETGWKLWGEVTSNSTTAALSDNSTPQPAERYYRVIVP